MTFAPDLANSIDRFGVGNFDVVSDAQASVRIVSAFDGHHLTPQSSELRVNP
ncbi:MAG TPA: hypothetical protein VF469_32100 [Kofleriaceae bacterium]